MPEFADLHSTPKMRKGYCYYRTADVTSTGALTSMGTELDWMRFYLAWNTVGTNKSSLDEIADVYIQACGGIPEVSRAAS